MSVVEVDFERLVLEVFYTVGVSEIDIQVADGGAQSAHGVEREAVGLVVVDQVARGRAVDVDVAGFVADVRDARPGKEVHQEGPVLGDVVAVQHGNIDGIGRGVDFAQSVVGVVQPRVRLVHAHFQLYVVALEIVTAYEGAGQSQARLGI